MYQHYSTQSSLSSQGFPQELIVRVISKAKPTKKAKKIETMMVSVFILVLSGINTSMSIK